MKRIVSIVCFGLLLVGLTACDRVPSSEATTTTISTTTTTTTTTVTTTTTAAIPAVGYCIADPSMHVRVGAGPYEEVIGGLAFGEQVSIVGKEGDWYRIVFKDGYAYVSAQYIIDTHPASTTTATTTTTTAAQASDATPSQPIE